MVTAPAIAKTRCAKLRKIELIGRVEERGAVDSLLESARAGMSGTLVIRGEAGIGKTSILEYAVTLAEGFTALRADGVESEQDISFAAIHRLLIPFMSGSAALPPPQRLALEATFGRIQADPPDRFMVGLAVLTLMSHAAEKAPLLCVIDDAQWIDGESADLLAFVGRRLYAEGVALLFAVRDPIERHDPFIGLPELRVVGLEDRDAQRLLASVAAAPLEPTTASRIVADTRGNPLALVELGQDAVLEGLTAGLLPDEPVPLGDRLENRFRRQVQSLPAPTQRFLLIAAAEPSNTAMVWKAADQLGLSPDAADPAITARLFDPRRTPAFRHPLIRSAVYGAALPAERRRIHTTLAALVDPSDADSRAWHLAAAAEGPQEEIAEELERGAARAHARGGWAARTAFLARAAELTPEGPRKAERLLTAASAAVIAGTPARAEALLGRARETLTDPLLIAQAGRVEAGLQVFNYPGRVPAILLEAATVLEGIDATLARDTFTEALQACLVSCQLTFDTTPAEVGAAALAFHTPPDKPQIADVMLEGFATRFAVGYQEAVPFLRSGIDALCAESTPPAGLTRWAVLGNNAAADLWDCDGFRQMLTRLEKDERERGALDSLRITLGGIGHCLMWGGDFAAADVAHSEATEISVALGGGAANWEALKVELFAWQGRDQDTRFVAGLLTGHFTESVGGGVGANLGRIAMIILDLAQGHYDEALPEALQLMADDPCPHGSQVLPDAVEAAVRIGDTLSAETALERLRERARESGTPWALGLLARSEALTTSGDPEPFYLRAIDLLGATYVKTDLARAHLVFGEWLRREKRRTEARDQLRAAYELFDAMGAKVFAERARIELTATGGRARRKNRDTAFDLTPQERQIALLASTGSTNQEIAARLFLSANTVDYHLRKVFRKLSVSSRRQLATALNANVA